MLTYIENQLEEISKLEDGWLGQNSKAIKKELFKIVKELSEFCESIGYNGQEICPLDDGSIYLFIDIDKDNNNYEIEISINSDCFVYLIFEDDKFDYIEEHDFETDDIEKLKEHIQKVKSLTLT